LQIFVPGRKKKGEGGSVLGLSCSGRWCRILNWVVDISMKEESETLPGAQEEEKETRAPSPSQKRTPEPYRNRKREESGPAGDNSSPCLAPIPGLGKLRRPSHLAESRKKNKRRLKGGTPWIGNKGERSRYMDSC